MEAGLAAVADLPHHLLLHLPPIQVHGPPLQCTALAKQNNLLTFELFRAVLLKQENPECMAGHSDVTKMEGGHIEITIGGQPQNCTFNQRPEKCDQRSHHRQQFEKVNIDGRS